MIHSKKISIVGGGTAGWLTALYANKLFPSSEITLIESEEIGIIGAGEGSTVGLVTFLQDLGINPSDLIKQVKSTLKLGIKFENWNGDCESYFHPFGPYTGRDDIDLSKFGFSLKNTRSTSFNDEGRFYLSLAINYGIDFDKIILNNILANNYKSNIVSDKMMSLNSFHFDAHQLALFLRSIGEQRGIKRIDGIVDSVDNDSEGYITSININDLSIECDFVFDCSGFKRLIIGNHYGTKWISYQDHLRVKAAIPFFLPQDEDKIFPYTRSISMKNGWMWQIPLQHRIGAGYIYDSDFIDQDEAHKEVEEFLGHKIDPIRTIKFNAGRFDQMWVKNCIAVGLSSGFTEPIEATSIMLTTVQLSLLNGAMGGIIHRDPGAIKKYNQIVSDINNHTMDFLSFHYVTKREDSDFWKSLKDHSFLPDNLKEQIKTWKYQIPTSLDNHSYWDQFTADNYILVGHGLGIFDNNKWNEYFSGSNAINNKHYWLEINRRLNQISDTAVDHLEYLKRLRHD